MADEAIALARPWTCPTWSATRSSPAAGPSSTRARPWRRTSRRRWRVGLGAETPRRRWPAPTPTCSRSPSTEYDLVRAERWYRTGDGVLRGARPRHLRQLPGRRAGDHARVGRALGRVRSRWRRRGSPCPTCRPSTGSAPTSPWARSRPRRCRAGAWPNLDTALGRRRPPGGAAVPRARSHVARAEARWLEGDLGRRGRRAGRLLAMVDVVDPVDARPGRHLGGPARRSASPRPCVGEPFTTWLAGDVDAAVADLELPAAAPTTPHSHWSMPATRSASARPWGGSTRSAPPPPPPSYAGCSGRRVPSRCRTASGRPPAPTRRG